MLVSCAASGLAQAQELGGEAARAPALCPRQPAPQFSEPTPCDSALQPSKVLAAGYWFSPCWVGCLTTQVLLCPRSHSPHANPCARVPAVGQAPSRSISTASSLPTALGVRPLPASSGGREAEAQRGQAPGPGHTAAHGAAGRPSYSPSFFLKMLMVSHTQS